MLIVMCIAGAAALAVVAYQELEDRSPETATAGLRAVRELASIVIVMVKAVEGVVDVLAGHRRLHATSAASSGWGYRSYDDYDEDER
jgi:hypothetical protein